MRPRLHRKIIGDGDRGRPHKTARHTREDGGLHVVIGASPHNLALACRIAQRGNSVLLVERRDEIGGAWYVRDLFGVDNLEVGCHYIGNLRAAYRLLNDLGVELPVMDVQPKVLVTSPAGADRLNSIRNRTLHSLGGFRRNRAFSWRLLSILTSIRTLRLGGTRAYRYPRGGCFELTETLSARLRDLGGSIRLGVEISSLELTDDGVRCHFGDDAIEADVVHLSRNQALMVRGTQKDALSEVGRQVLSEHVLLEVAGRKRIPFSVLLVHGDPRMALVSDVGQWAGIDDGLVLAISVRAEGTTHAVNGNVAAGGVAIRDTEGQRLLAQEMLTRLMQVGLLHGGATLSRGHCEYYELSTGEPDPAAWPSDRVRFYDSTDLAESLKMLDSRLAWN